MNFKKSVAVPQPAGICKEKCWLSAWSWKWGFVPCLLAVGSWKMYLESLSLPCIQSGEAGLIFFSTFCCLFFFFLTRVFLRGFFVLVFFFFLVPYNFCVLHEKLREIFLYPHLCTLLEVRTSQKRKHKDKRR